MRRLGVVVDASASMISSRAVLSFLPVKPYAFMMAIAAVLASSIFLSNFLSASSSIDFWSGPRLT